MHQMAKVLELQLQHQSFQRIFRTDFFRIDWFDLLATQVTLKSLLQHYSSEASVLWCSAFFMVQLSHPYMTTGKTIALTRQTFVGKVMSLLFNMLSRLVITFLPRRKRLLISWLQSPSAVILKVLVAQSCLTLCNPLAVALQAPLSMGFPRQEYWSGLPFPPPGDLPNPGIELSCVAGGFRVCFEG